MDGASDQFLAGTGLAQNQDGGMTGSDGGHLVEYFLEGGTVADNFREVAFGTDLAFQILFLFFQMIFEAFDFGGGAMVFESYRKLGGDLTEQSQVFGSKSVCPGAAELKNA